MLTLLIHICIYFQIAEQGEYITVYNPADHLPPDPQCVCSGWIQQRSAGQ